MHVVRIAGLVSSSEAISIENITSVMKVRQWIHLVSSGKGDDAPAGPSN